MPRIKAYVKEPGYNLAAGVQHVDPSWVETFEMVRDYYPMDPDTLPNTSSHPTWQ